MPSLVKSLQAASAALAAIVPLASAFPAGVFPRNVTGAYKPKVILDNDWSTAGFVTFLLPLASDWDVLGVVSDTADSWALETGLHALATLEVGNLSCIPVYKGSDYPLIQTEERFQAWEAIHGVLPWEGVFAAKNLTHEAEGNDPTSGNPDRISYAAFYEGFPNTTFANDTNAASFMVEMVKKYPGEVSIYSGGALTNIALAVRMDPDFAKNAKELVIMGGYIDVNLLQTSGSVMQADLNSDINLIVDPEAAKIALTADFPNITIAGNVANQVSSTQEFLDEVYEVKSVYSELMYNYYGTTFPFWDETAAAIILDPSIVKNSTTFYLDVDIAYASPSYGNIHAYREALAPPDVRTVNYVIEIDGNKLKSMIKNAVQYPKTCAQL
ncbi:inosine-uridine preferring nucleoside hydrolase [Phyllosticta citriasiana]|uniref:Inosine-uridine preferring nucleoside hydrolase n=1 Tax=Phyllosticta citriasiana TaxID=595635 RepID=A0ABR1L1F7_9PEZI